MWCSSHSAAYDHLDGGESDRAGTRLSALRQSPTLFERDAELASIGALLDGAAAGDSRLVLFEGEAGIGKTRLVAELRRRAAGRGLAVLSARGSELERSFSFGVVRQLLESAVLADPERVLAGAAAPARPVFEPLHDAPAAEEASFAALHGLYWVVVNLTADAPLVLAVDDLHWCDRASLRFLAYLVRRLEGLPMLIAGSARPIAQAAEAALLAELAHDPAALSVRPGPLSQEAAASVIEERFGAHPDGAFVVACHAATGGNPLLLHEVVRELHDEGVEPTAASATVVAELGPRAVARAVILRLSRLDAEAVAVARALAVLGDGAELPHVAALAEVDEVAASRAVGALARAEIVRPDLPLGFLHPLLGDAVYRDIAIGERGRAHERAARLLDAAGRSAEHVAAHLLLVPARGDAWVVDTLERAAQGQASAGSSVAFLERAIAEPPAPERRPGLLFALGCAEAMSSGPRALDHLRAAYRLAADDADRARFAVMLAHTLIATDHAREAAAFIDEITARPGDAELHRRLRALRLAAGMWEHSLRDEAMLVRIREAGLAPDGQSLGACMQLGMAAYEWMARGASADECVALARRALADGVLVAGENGGVAQTGALLVLALADQEEAAAEAASSLEAAHRHGTVRESCPAHIFSGFTLLLRGELSEADRLLQTGQEQLSLWGFGPGLNYYPATYRAEILLERGDPAGARAMLDATRPSADAPDNVHTAWWNLGHVRQLLQSGQHDAAAQTAQECLQRFRETTTGPPTHPWRSLRALALARLGRHDEAEECAAEELELLRRWRGPRAVSRALRILAQVRRDAALPLLEEAVALTSGTPARLEHARGLAALGTTLRLGRQPTLGREPLRQALDLATACEATALVEHVRTELYATGARPRGSAVQGPNALTPSERRVAELAVEGQSNRDIAQRLFVTPKTVEVHLSSVYRKLGIRSRRDLPGALAPA